MSVGTATAEITQTEPARSGAGVGRIAWRNLWRNRRRTWLTSGGIAFAVWLLIFAMSMQNGTFEIMIDNIARLFLGHVQIQHPAYQDDPRMEYTIHDVPALEALVRTTPGVTMVSQRAQSFALVSHGERSFGAQVQGVEPDREARWSSLPGRVISGRYLAGPGEAFIGSALARNLDLAVGDEIVFLGTASEGGVAAAVADVVGIFDSGQVELDRSLAQIPIDDFRAGWGLASDEAHALVILAESVAESVVVAKTLAAELGSDLRVLDWRALMPEAVQTIDLKFAGAVLIFALVATIVTFSVVNTFMMTVFERTPEFGMLMAIGMRPGRIMGQLALEALCLGALGVALGVAISVVVLVPLGRYGLPLPADAAELLKAYQLPDHMYPRFSVGAAAAAGVIMMVGTQVAALIPALRIRKLRPVEALRADA